MALGGTIRQRRAPARRGHRLDAATLDVYTAAWLTRRFMRVAGSEVRRTARTWRRSRSRRRRG